ncbi:hypothetical protein OF83DRAFT_1175628 [Amylostereum chailletii]|nr:hypothetical protein OF83DRAFT_1175628 [Amylostereum chailletii]
MPSPSSPKGTPPATLDQGSRKRKRPKLLDPSDDQPNDSRNDFSGNFLEHFDQELLLPKCPSRDDPIENVLDTLRFQLPRPTTPPNSHQSRKPLPAELKNPIKERITRIVVVQDLAEDPARATVPLLAGANLDLKNDLHFLFYSAVATGNNGPAVILAILYGKGVKPDIERPEYPFVASSSHYAGGGITDIDFYKSSAEKDPCEVKTSGVIREKLNPFNALSPSQAFIWPTVDKNGDISSTTLLEDLVIQLWTQMRKRSTSYGIECSYDVTIFTYRRETTLYLSRSYLAIPTMKGPNLPEKPANKKKAK